MEASSARWSFPSHGPPGEVGKGRCRSNGSTGAAFLALRLNDLTPQLVSAPAQFLKLQEFELLQDLPIHRAQHLGPTLALPSKRESVGLPRRAQKWSLYAKVRLDCFPIECCMHE